MPKIVKRNEQKKDGKIHINFDVAMLNSLIKYTRCIGWVDRPQIDTLLKLIRQIDINTYNYNEDVQIRIKIIKSICEGIVEENIMDNDVLEMYVRDHVPDGLEVLNNLGLRVNALNKSECDTIEKAIVERLHFSYLYGFKDTILKLYDEIEQPTFNSYYSAIERLKDELGKLLVNLQSSSAPDEMIREFDFSGFMFDNMVQKIVARAKKASTILKTGMRCLNAMLSPGFESGRLYLFLGGTGKGKSGVLLNIADQIRLFNPQIIPVENGIRKTIVFLTQENTVQETIERLFDMYNDTGVPMKNLEAAQVIKTLRENGKFTFDGENGIDIDILYFADLEIKTSDIYQILFNLRDRGKQPIALINDYILKLDSARDSQNDERIRLTNCGKELKVIAQIFDIPVITAMQFNREGNAIIDAATTDEREGILNFVGPSMIGTAWGLINECDWVGAINLERRRSTNSVYMAFKLYKIRGKRDAMGIDYFNHPFVSNNSLRLMPDVDKNKTVSMILNAADLESIEDDSKKVINFKNGQNRPKIKDVNAERDNGVNVINRIDMQDFTMIA